MTQSETNDSGSLLCLTNLKFILLNKKCNPVVSHGLCTYAALEGMWHLALYRCCNGVYQDVLLQGQGNHLDGHIGRTVQVFLGECADVGA